MSNSDQAMKGISKTSSGYTARIYRGAKETSESFSIKEYGSGAAALESAKKWIKAMNTLVPPKPRATGLNITPGTDTGNGLSGVLTYWNVTWRDDEERLHSKKFYYKDDTEKKKKLKEAENFKKNL